MSCTVVCGVQRAWVTIRLPRPWFLDSLRSPLGYGECLLHGVPDGHKSLSNLQQTPCPAPLPCTTKLLSANSDFPSLAASAKSARVPQGSEALGNKDRKSTGPSSYLSRNRPAQGSLGPDPMPSGTTAQRPSETLEACAATNQNSCSEGLSTLLDFSCG